MAYFVIGGKPDCSAFVHAVHVARYLEESLPNFSVHIIQKISGEWEPWLEERNWKNRWHHSSSPVIWKELSMRGGVPHYVGGLSEFWEYCYDYYGLQSIISPENLQKLVADSMQYFQEMEKIEKEKSKHVRHIGIIGACNPILPLFLSELIQIPDLQQSGGMVISLLDLETQYVEVKEYTIHVLEDIQELPTTTKLETNVVDRIQDVLSDCEVLIVFGDYTRRYSETDEDWLIRNMSEMVMLADEINVFAKRYLKVILAVDGPVCFDANVLIDTCTSIRIRNIVAVTSDVGLGVLQYAARQANVILSKLNAPPVWGCVGISHFVDVDSVIICCDIYRPYQRVLRNKGGSTLPLGIIQSELRYMNYLIEDVENGCDKALEARKIIKKQLHRAPMFAKVRATISLLKLWYAKEPSDEIISLGICSDGSHGLAAGTVFSQPAILEENLWVPFKNFPVSRKTTQEIQKSIKAAVEITEKLNVGQYRIDSNLFQSIQF